MDDTAFLIDSPKGDISFKINGPEGVFCMSNICQDSLLTAAPLLLDRLTIEDDQTCIIFNKESVSAIISLLRYIYIFDYRASDGLIDQPCSLLLHFQMFRLGERYEMPDLQFQARRYIIQELEYACSVKMAAIDLCEAIRFLYLELDEHLDLKEYVAHYCVQCFIYHDLGKSEVFCQTVYEAPQFHQLLCHINMSQEFSAEGAQQIMTMRVCPHRAHWSPEREIARAANFLCRFHSDGLEDMTLKVEPQPWREPSRSNSFVLVERPAVSGQVAERTIEPVSLPIRPAAAPLDCQDLDALEAALGYGNNVPSHDGKSEQLLVDSPTIDSVDFHDSADSDWSPPEPPSSDDDEKPLLLRRNAANNAGPQALSPNNGPDIRHSNEEEWEWVERRAG